jgi:hypothetical protein
MLTAFLRWLDRLPFARSRHRLCKTCARPIWAGEVACWSCARRKYRFGRTACLLRTYGPGGRNAWLDTLSDNGERS